MIDREIHWDLLRGHILFFLLCVMVAGGLVYYASFRYDEVHSEFQRERSKLRRFARNYRETIQEEKLYKTYVEQFEQFSVKGYIGDEPRLVWIETLREINQTLKLPVLKWDIKPREPFVLPSPNIEPNEQVILYESVMNLEMGLLHAGDLYVFFDELEKHAPGLFEVRGCDLRVSSPDVQFDTDHPNVDVLCMLSWYTVDVTAENEILEQ